MQKGGSLKKTTSDNDAADLQHLGYVQELVRELGGFSNFAVSFSVISILTGAIQLYGYGLAHGGPLQMTLGWCLVSMFTLTVGLAMGELASAFPTAGALYHWSHLWGGRELGWFAASFNTIGQFAILAGIDWGLTQFLIGLIKLENTPLTAFAIYFSLLFSHAFLNHIGIKVVAWLNDFSAWYHLVVVFLLVGLLAWKGTSQPISFLFEFNSSDGFHPAYSFLVGLLLAQWTLSGYDASAHVTEETHDPRCKAPWGIFLAITISIAAGLLMLVFVTLSIGDLKEALAFGDSAFIEIIKSKLGAEMGILITSLIAGAMWLCGLAAMTSASRMVYAFARDEGLPFSKIWSKVSESHRTPSNAIWGLAGLALVLALSVDAVSAVISIATIALYISYGLPIAARTLSRFQKRNDVIGPWHLGKWSLLNSCIALIWIVFICVIFVLPPNEKAGWVIGGLFLLLLVIWFSYVGKKFKGPHFAPGVKS